MQGVCTNSETGSCYKLIDWIEPGGAQNPLKNAGPITNTPDHCQPVVVLIFMSVAVSIAESGTK